MRIKKWVKFEDEIDIELSADEIHMLLCESDEPINVILGQMNNIAKFLKGIPEKTIIELTDAQREVIGNFWAEQSLRFKNAASPKTIKA